jgi:hypothetical protein
MCITIIHFLLNAQVIRPDQTMHYNFNLKTRIVYFSDDKLIYHKPNNLFLVVNRNKKKRSAKPWSQVTTAAP